MSSELAQTLDPEAALNDLASHLGIGGLASVLHQAACIQRQSGLDGLTLSHQGTADGIEPGYAISIGRDISDITFNGNGPHEVNTQTLYEKLAAMAAPTIED